MSQSVTESRCVDEASAKYMQITVSHQGNGKYNVSFRRVIIGDGFFSTSLLGDRYQCVRVQVGTRFSKKNMNAILQENLHMFDDAGFIEFAKGGDN